MTAKEILLKHVNEGKSERVKKLHEIVDWSMFIAAMEEYAEQQVKNLNKPVVSKTLPVESCCLLIERITHINRLTTDKEKTERLIELVKATGFELTYKGNVC